jgi:glyceraldehyde 3-phosphate dehydrogenase
MARIAIHGFGRIGRSLLRVALKNDLFVPVSISDSGTFRRSQRCSRSTPIMAAGPRTSPRKTAVFVVGGREIPYFDSMKALPNWKALGVDW